ncbi:MAG: hypothetical protein AAGI69_04480 [Cyanobacteria bacterium P01_H01_bin.21]
MSEHRLSEIVIERPRGGMRIRAKKLKGYRKELNQITQIATEDGLLRPYLIKPRQQTKWLSDHLGPLRRLLRSQVGQPWNQVYSRLCRDLNPGTMAGQHVIDHLWDFVERHVEFIDGLPYAKHGYRSWQGERRSLADSYGTKFYVHPETGLLCVVPPMCRNQSSKSPKNQLTINRYEQYRQINNIWYYIVFKPIASPFVWDVLLKETIDTQKALYTYGQNLHAVKKRQCSKRDLKKVRQLLT